MPITDPLTPGFVAPSENTGIPTNSGVRTSTTSTAVAAGDGVVLLNGASLVLTLPDPTTVRSGRQVVGKNLAATAASVVSAGTATIDGVASYALTAQYSKATFVTDGTQWYVVA